MGKIQVRRAERGAEPTQVFAWRLWRRTRKGGDGPVALDGSPGGPSLHQRLCHPERGEVPEKAWHHSRVGDQRELLRRSNAEQQLKSTARGLPPRLLVPESPPDLSEHAGDPREDSLRVKPVFGSQARKAQTVDQEILLILNDPV